jgi:hypothetical protein
MTDKIKLYETEISKHLLNKDFDSIYRIFLDSSSSATELLIFYRRKKEILNNKTFWTSQLPHFHLQAIVESDFKITFLHSYLSSDQNCNDELNKHLAFTTKSDFIKFIKLWEVFNKSNFYNSLISISEIDTDCERLMKELNIVIKAQQKIADEAKKDEKLILQHSFDEIALAFSLYYYDFKQRPEILSNKKWQTQVEMTLVNEFNKVISIFKEQNNAEFQFASNDELQKVFQRNEAPHHTLGKKGLWTPVESKFQNLFLLISRMIERNSINGQIQLYLAGYFDFETTILNPARLKSNSNYRIFKINDNKSSPEEYYFIDLKIEDILKLKPLTKTDITSSLNCLIFYGIPEFVSHNGKEIEVKKALQLLKYFSVYKGPKERQIISDGKKTTSFVLNQGDEKFRELFGSNESITLFEYDKLAQGISSYFNWKEQETQSILSFLTFDTSSPNSYYSWVSRPFMKYQNQVLWLGSFLKDRRWDNIFLNKFKRDYEFKSLGKLIASNFERKIEELFRSSGFTTISSLPFKSSNGQSGDFDVLAFKDNFLIVCEAKTGIRSDEFLHAAKSEAVRLEGCAADQLVKAINNIKEDWTNLKSKLGISESLKIEDIEIIPLIVTDYFEGDLHLYKNSILKTSLLELEVNLKNNKQNLLEMYMMMQSSMNRFNSTLNENRKSPANWDLWNGQNNCSVENLIQNLESNAIWEELQSVWKFEDERLLLDY